MFFSLSDNLIIRRGLAFTVDFLSSFTVAYVSFHLSWKEILSLNDICFLMGIIHFFMTTLFYLMNRASSMGQRFLAIEVVGKEGDRASFVTLCLRNVIFCVLFFGVFYDILIAVVFLVVLSRTFITKSETFLDLLLSTKMIIVSK